MLNRLSRSSTNNSSMSDHSRSGEAREASNSTTHLRQYSSSDHSLPPPPPPPPPPATTAASAAATWPLPVPNPDQFQQQQQRHNPSSSVQQRRTQELNVRSNKTPLSILPPNPRALPDVDSPAAPYQSPPQGDTGSRPLRTPGWPPVGFSPAPSIGLTKSRSKKGPRWDVFGSVLNSRLSQMPHQTSVATQEAERDRQNSRAEMRQHTPSIASQQSKPQMQEVNFAVVGGEAVGKSSFIARALDLSSETATPLQAKNYTLNGTLYAVRLLEVSSEDIKTQPDGQIEWPLEGDMAIARHAQGAIVLYDIMNPHSLPPLPKILNALKKSQIPAVLAACKCDNPPSLREIDPDLVEEKAKSLIEGINVFQISHAQSDGQQLCVSVLLREVVYGQAGKPSAAMVSRPRAKSNTTKRTPTVTTSPQHQNPHHHHLFSLSERHSPTDNPPKSPSKVATTTSTLSPKSSSTRLETAVNGPKSITDQQTFLAIDENEGPMYRGPVQAMFPSPTEQKPASFHELVAYLLSPPETTKDQQFVSIFLAFYRIFAAPYVLLEAIIAHFDIIGGDEAFTDPTEDEDLRYRDLLILGQWINTYPGDFAHELTQNKLREFLHVASSESKFQALAQQIDLALDIVAVDDDTRWGNTDGGLVDPTSPVKGAKSRRRTFLSTSSVSSAESSDKKSSPPSPVSPVSLKQSSREEVDSQLSSSDAMGPPRPSMGLDGKTILLPRAAEAVLREAQLLVPKPVDPLTKEAWRALMAFSDDAIARELTRIDWIMFSCIRPRDLIRHVTVPVFDRHRFRSLVNVNRMIEHFNFLAYWVTNMILFRDKPKHRALALEKLMRVARKLRAYNNYNALGAVVAGIQGTSVHRLVSTKELVPEDIERDFMKLEVLMSTPKGHAAYRLAWENSRSERIPFLPLHRRDLVTADAGGKTFIPAPPDAPPAEPAKINWKKLTVMGEALLSIQRAQATPYIGLDAHPQLQHLILNLDIIKDDDELYERSLVVEPSATGERLGDARTKVMNWFGKY